MIEVNVETHSIQEIEKQAAKAFSQNDIVNPYRFGSIASRIWTRHYEKCACDDKTGGGE